MKIVKLIFFIIGCYLFFLGTDLIEFAISTSYLNHLKEQGNENELKFFLVSKLGLLISGTLLVGFFQDWNKEMSGLEKYIQKKKNNL